MGFGYWCLCWMLVSLGHMCWVLMSLGPICIGLHVWCVLVSLGASVYGSSVCWGLDPICCWVLVPMIWTPSRKNGADFALS